MSAFPQNSFGHLMADLVAKVGTCESIAQALIESGEPWWRDVVVALLRPTDFQRARGDVIRTCSSVLGDIRRLRLNVLNPDLIRAQRQVKDLRRCCDQCPALNLQRRQMGKSFICQVLQHDTPQQPTGFRFELDTEGRINERR